MVHHDHSHDVWHRIGSLRPYVIVGTQKLAMYRTWKWNKCYVQQMHIITSSCCSSSSPPHPPPPSSSSFSPPPLPPPSSSSNSSSSPPPPPHSFSFSPPPSPPPPSFSSSVELQSNPDRCLLNGFLPLSSVFYLLIQGFKFAFIKIWLTQFLQLFFGHPASHLP